MIKWEYTVFKLKSMYNMFWMDHLEEVLNSYGSQGWELVSFDEEESRVILKRPRA